MGKTDLDTDTRKSFIFIRNRILVSEPRKVFTEPGAVYHVYTDASYEDGKAGLGGVLFDGLGNMLSYFSCELDEVFAGRLNPENKKTIIYEMETLAALIGTSWLLDPLGIKPSDRIVLFIDSEATLASVILGRGSGSVGATIVNRLMEWEFSKKVSLWCERVPSAANIADLPSRHLLEAFDNHLRVEIDVESLVQDLVNEICSNK